MATGSCGTELSDLRMIVLGTIRHHCAADAEEIAAWLRFPVALIEALCDELEAVGRLTLARGN
jgi:hypothetical protein